MQAEGLSIVYVWTNTKQKKDLSTVTDYQKFPCAIYFSSTWLF